MKSDHQNFNRASTPVYLVSIISFLIASTSGLTVFIYKENADITKQDIQQIQDVNISQGNDIASIKQSIEYIVKGQDETRNDVKQILKILK